MSALTSSQLAKKQEVEAAGGTFIPPSQYRKVKKGALKANPNQIATYAAKKQYKSTYKRISPETEAVIDQILDPESSAGNAVRFPNTYGKSAIYSVKNIINAQFSTDNKCSVVAHPRLRNAIFTTNGFSGSYTLEDITISSLDRPYLVQSMSLSKGQTVNISSPIQFPDKKALFPAPNEGTGKLLYEMNVPPSPGTSGYDAFMQLIFPQAGQNQLSVKLSKYGPSYGLISTADFPVSSGGVATLQMYSSTGGVDSAEYYALEVSINGAPWAGLMNGYMVSSGIAVTVPLNISNSAEYMNVYDIKDADTLIENAEKSFVMAQSMLITPNLSDLNNGGVVAIARLPGGSNVGEGSGSADANSWYDWLASLATDNYDGAVKDGAYSWYLPEDERGYFYRDNSTYLGPDLPYMVSQFTVSDSTEGSLVRIKVCSIVQFTTNSSAFQLGISPMCAEIHEIHHLLSLVGACYENNTHREQLKKMLKQAGNKVKKVVKNPENWTKTASYLAALLL